MSYTKFENIRFININNIIVYEVKKFFLKMNEKNQKPVIIIESGGKQKTGTMDTDGKIKFRKGGNKIFYF